MTALLVSRDEAKKLITARIEEGKRLASAVPTSLDHYKQLVGQVRKWAKVTETLLSTVFSDSKFIEDFNNVSSLSSPPSRQMYAFAFETKRRGMVGQDRLSKVMDQIPKHMGARLTALEAIVESLEYLPEPEKKVDTRKPSEKIPAAQALSSSETEGVEIFYAYSRKDEELRDALETHLALMKRQGLVAGWYDRLIDAGQDWNGEIDKHLDSADIILLLVSAYFINSDYCYGVEVQRALQRHNKGNAVVIPVILRPVDWEEAPFAKLQALPKDGKPVTTWNNRDEAFLSIVKGLRSVVTKLIGATGSSPAQRTSAGNHDAVNASQATVELKRLQREAQAASRRDPEDMATFEQKLHEIDLLEDLAPEDKLDALHHLGQEVSLNSDKGTQLLVEHILWGIVAWDRPSIVSEIMEIDSARQFLDQIATVLWDIGRNGVEYGRGKDAVKTVTDAILGVSEKARGIQAHETISTCENALESMLGCARSDNRTHVIDVLITAVETLKKQRKGR